LAQSWTPPPRRKSFWLNAVRLACLDDQLQCRRSQGDTEPATDSRLYRFG